MRKPLAFSLRTPAAPAPVPAEPPSAAAVPAEQMPADPAAAEAADPQRPVEIGGPKGPDPTRYGDWEIGGRCIDF